MSERVERFGFLIVLSMVFALELTTWQMGAGTRLSEVLIFLGVGFAGALVGAMVDWLTKQARWTFSSSMLLAFFVALLVAYYFSGYAWITLGVSLLVALVIGVGLGFLSHERGIVSSVLPAAVVLGILFSGMTSWRRLFFDAEGLWGLVIITGIPFLFFSLFSPDEEIGLGSWYSALAIFLVAVWVGPVRSGLMHGEPKIGWLSFTLFSAGIIFLASSLPSSFWMRLHVADYARNLRFGRSMRKLLDKPSLNKLKSFDILYQDAKGVDKDLLLTPKMIQQYQQAYAGFIVQPQMMVGRVLASKLPSLYKKASPELKKAIDTIFVLGVQSGKNYNWQLALEKMMVFNPDGAVLASAGLPDEKLWEEALGNIAALYPTKAVRLAKDRIETLPTDTLVDLLMHQRGNVRDVAEKAFRQVCRQAGFREEQKEQLKARILQRYKLSLKEVEAVLAGKIVLSEILYPFAIRPLESMHIPHMEEFVCEPDCRITAAHVSAWIYRKAGQVTDVVLAGHANLPVCKEVSAKMATTLLLLKEQPDHAVNVTGAGLIMNTGAISSTSPVNPMAFSTRTPAEKPPLTDLFEQLVEVQKKTGMVNVHEAGQDSYAGLKAEFQETMQTEMRSGLPKLVKVTPKDGDSPAFFMPFYKLNDGMKSPLSFEIKRSDLGKEFEELLTLHKYAYYGEMIADVKRRRRVYQEWLERDRWSLYSSALEMFTVLAKHIRIDDSERKAQEYAEKMIETPAAEWQLFQAPQGRALLEQRRAAVLYKFLVGTRGQDPLQIPPEFIQAVALIQAQDKEIHGSRNYVDLTIEQGGVPSYMSLQAMVEGNLPSLIREDKRWLEQMDKLLEKIDDSDPARKKQIEKQNLEVFMDSFLRGWPAIFLPVKEQQERYTAWQTKERENVWRKIRDILFNEKLQMIPLQEDNVVFSIQDVDSNTLRITPYYLTTRNSFAVFLDTRVGITHYRNPWQRRKAETRVYKQAAKKRASYAKVMALAKEKLAHGSIPDVVANFKEAIRLYPIAAVEQILTDYWEETNANTSERFSDFATLVKEISNRRRNPNLYQDVLVDFIGKYPDFLPDPYLYLGFSEHAGADRIYEQWDILFSMNRAYLENLDNLEEMGILRRNPDTPGQYGILSGYISVQEELQQDQENMAEKRAAVQESERKLWELVQKKRPKNKNIQNAMALDHHYVNLILGRGQIGTSENYHRYVGPLYGILKGQVFMGARETLVKQFYVDETLSDILQGWGLGKKEDVILALKALRDRMKIEHYIETDDLKSLNEWLRFLDNLHQVDSVTRENIAPQQLRSLLSDLLYQAYKAYNLASNSVLGLTELPRWLTDTHARNIHYINAYNTLLGTEKVVLANGYPGVEWNILNTDAMNIATIAFLSDSQTFVVTTETGEEKPVLALKGLSESDAKQISAEVQRPNYLKQIQGSKLRPAYALLYTPVPPPAHTQVWRDVLKSLKPWLIYSFAHFVVLPLEGKEIGRDEIFTPFDKHEVIQDIQIDMNSLD